MGVWVLKEQLNRNVTQLQLLHTVWLSYALEQLNYYK